MLGFLKKSTERLPLFLYNTLSKTKEEFKTISGKKVKMYTCGPTVYDYAHIGNLRAYVFADTLRRTLEYAGLSVKQVINITDVGHLAQDSDDGEDKMTNALKREGKELTIPNMKLLGESYTSLFIEDLKALNVEMPFVFPRATAHIHEQIAFISSLFQKGYAYKTSDGIYFDTAKFPSYGALGVSDGGQALPSLGQARIVANPEKHDQRDFALWKFDSSLGFEAPWGKGFPGWHIECTAMATKYLGKSFDIHTGGVDHIAIHHNNEIAQAEAVSGKRFVNYWMHGEFITIEGKRIGKSEGNAIRLYQLRERNVSPTAYRYLLLTAHYRSLLNFTWEAVLGAQTALQRAQRMFADFPAGGHIATLYRTKFGTAINDDLNIPIAIAVMWELLKDDSVTPADKRATILDFDRVFGLGFGTGSLSESSKVSVTALSDVPTEVASLVKEREEARGSKDWARADALRLSIEEQGFTVEDAPEGPIVHKTSEGFKG
ncbi:MAG: cysteinyl-tRNA synthetase [Parcubacteria group bacterium Greene0714_7]|nr:MAG: cysteinyl-tRNA synthetase [Parcubacteria group bacterium Greene0714_7]